MKNISKILLLGNFFRHVLHCYSCTESHIMLMVNINNIKFKFKKKIIILYNILKNNLCCSYVTK